MSDKLKKLLKHETITSVVKKRYEGKKKIYQDKLAMIEKILSKKVKDI